MVLHEDKVGGFDGAVGPFPHGDPEVGRGEGRGIIDAVAHHGHAAGPGELFDLGDLFVRQQARIIVGQSDFACDFLRGAVVVAREHDRTLDACCVEAFDDVMALFPDLIGDAEEAEDPLFIRDDDQGVAFPLKLLDFTVHLV